MSVVFRPRGTKLGREVALKICSSLVTRHLSLIPWALWVWVVMNPSAGAAQSPAPSPTAPAARLVVPRRSSPSEQGATEWSWTSGGGPRLAGGAQGVDFWATQLRWGQVLTAPHGPGLLRGTLEYAVEAVPAIVLVQTRTLFGAGVNPSLLQYNFSGNARLVPFVQAGSGLLFTSRDFPEGVARFNFTPQGGVGVYWLRQERSSAVFGVRYHHISNGGRVRPNPGHNALYFYTGISWWR